MQKTSCMVAADAAATAAAVVVEAGVPAQPTDYEAEAVGGWSEERDEARWSESYAPWTAAMHRHACL